MTPREWRASYASTYAAYREASDDNRDMVDNYLMAMWLAEHAQSASEKNSWELLADLSDTAGFAALVFRGLNHRAGYDAVDLDTDHDYAAAMLAYGDYCAKFNEATRMAAAMDLPREFAASRAAVDA